MTPYESGGLPSSKFQRLLGIGQAFDTTWHSGLLYKLSEFLTNLINILPSFITDKKFKFLVESKFSVPRKISALVRTVFDPILCSLYINDAPAAPGIYFALFADNACIYATYKTIMFSANCNVALLQ